MNSATYCVVYKIDILHDDTSSNKNKKYKQENLQQEPPKDFILQRKLNVQQSSYTLTVTYKTRKVDSFVIRC